MLRSLAPADPSLEPTVLDFVMSLDDEFLEGLAHDIARDATTLELSTDRQAELYAEILESYQALSNHAANASRKVPDLFIVATLCALAATDEGGDYLASLVEPLGGGLFHVSLVDREGRRMGVIVGEPRRARAFGDGRMSEVLALIERALLTANDEDAAHGPYAGTPHASLPFEIMAQLGLASHGASSKALRGFPWKSGDSVRVGSFDVDRLSSFGLHPMRSYTVVGAFHDAVTGEPMLVLHDPWGTKQPAPLPETAVDALFGPAAYGTLQALGA